MLHRSRVVEARILAIVLGSLAVRTTSLRTTVGTALVAPWDQNMENGTRTKSMCIYKSFEVGICVHNLSLQYSTWAITRFRPRHKSRQKSFCMVRQCPVGILLDLKPSAEVKAGPESKGAWIHSSKLVASTGTEQSKNFLEAIPQWHPASFCF